MKVRKTWQWLYVEFLLGDIVQVLMMFLPFREALTAWRRKRGISKQVIREWKERE